MATPVEQLIAEARQLGAEFRVGARGEVLVRSMALLPQELRRALLEHKASIVACLEEERHREFDCWVLEEWRRVSIPDWRRILGKSITQRDTRRVEYARWMLRDILLDPDYREEQA